MTPQVTLPSLSSRLYKRFLEAEVDFFCAFAAGDHAMEGFSRSWSILTRDFQSALLTTVLETKLLEVAHAVSSTIANFGYGMEDIRVHSETSTELVIDELTLVLSDMSLNDRSICRFNCDPDNPLLCHWPCLPDSSPRSSRRYRLPPYIPSAFSWLLDNIHNPYPSNIVKKSLAQVAHSTPRRIGDWFKDMRQYIGWGAVCNSHFGGSRAAMVRAARRALVHDGVVGPVHNEGVLISIRDTVESLYVPERCAAFITATSTTPNQPTRPPRLSPTPSLASCHSDDSDNDEVIPELDPPHPAHETVLPAVFESQRDLMDPEFFNQYVIFLNHALRSLILLLDPTDHYPRCAI